MKILTTGIMKVSLHVCSILNFILIIGCLNCFGQVTENKPIQKSQEAADTVDSLNNVRELFFIEKARRMAKQDSVLLISFTSQKQDAFSPGLVFHHHEELFRFGDGSTNQEMSLLFRYKKLNMSNSGSLDFKKLSEQLPKTYEFNNLGLLLFAIFNKNYSTFNPSPAPDMQRK